MGRGFHVLLFYSFSSCFLGLEQNCSKPSCVQLPVGKGNTDPEKRNKSRGASSLLWELTRLCCLALLQLQVPSWHLPCPGALQALGQTVLAWHRVGPTNHRAYTGQGPQSLCVKYRMEDTAQHRCLETEGQVCEQDLCSSGLQRDGAAPPREQRLYGAGWLLVEKGHLKSC